MQSPRQNESTAQYQELHKHEGSPLYEVVIVIEKESNVPTIWVDLMGNYLYPESYRDLPKPQQWDFYKVDNNGAVIDNIDIADMVKDGTILGSNYWQSWVIDSSKVRKPFLDVLSEKEKINPDLWIKKYASNYANAESAFNKSNFGYYFLKVDGDIIKFHVRHEELINLQDRFPDKGLIRMKQLEDLTPDIFYQKEGKASKDLLEHIDYEEKDREEGRGMNPINFSGGVHYLNLYMPGGDTIKIKRYGSMGMNLKIYKIPEEYGGRDDVVFIVQKRNTNLAPNKEWGGMYVVRPRGLVKPE